MTLSQTQQKFSKLLGEFLVWIYQNPDWSVTLGEAYRTPEQAALNASTGRGISNSLHTKRLAVDLNLFIKGKYQTSTEAHKPLGEWWEAHGGAWGGRFSKPDGNHYSLEWEGVK